MFSFSCEAGMAAKKAAASAEMANVARHFAGRMAIGTNYPATVAKEGIKHTQVMQNGTREMMVIGAACSEIFHGPRLAKILAPGLELQAQAMQALLNNEAAPCLSMHTSAGVPAALDDFVATLGPHLPWADS